MSPKGQFSKKMIRLFTTLCKALFEKLTDVGILNDATDGFRRYDEKCPSCGAVGKLSLYGNYSRNIVSHKDGMTIDSRISPRRFECLSCGVTHALLPDILIPYSPYSLRFKLAVLTAYFERKTTVASVCERFGIAASTLYSWKQRLLEHKELLFGTLASLEVSAITFVQSLFGASCLSGHLQSFFNRHAFSFMQHTPAIATRSRPP